MPDLESNLDAFRYAFQRCPLIVSVQAGDSSPLEDPDTLLRCAKASVLQGVRVLRLEGIRNINHLHEHLQGSLREIDPRGGSPLIIGLIKRYYEDSEVYITPTFREVDELIQSPCQIVALDATARGRPGDATLGKLIDRIHRAGKLAIADIDTVENAVTAATLEVDILSTTLSGYTAESPPRPGPDFDLLRAIRKALGPKHPFLVAEGRFTEKWQTNAALRIGADAVVVGGAINDPIKNTRRLLPLAASSVPVAAIDIGGTWIRAVSVPSNFLELPPQNLEIKRAPLPQTQQERIAWIAAFLEEGHYKRVGISTGGVVWNNVVTLSKKFIPENQGTDYNVLRPYLKNNDPVGVIALGDGHASAWGHACHPDFAGKDVVVLAIGTGLGFGHVRQGRIVMGKNGEYSRLNDSPTLNGKTFEQLLGGAALTPNPSEEQKRQANEAVEHAIRMVSTFLFPDVVVVCGTVGMQPWLNLNFPKKEGWPDIPVVRSPLGAEAGLYGAAALATYPPLLSS